MTQTTFGLTQSFKAKIFERFLDTLARLNADAAEDVASPNADLTPSDTLANLKAATAELLKPYARVTNDDLMVFIESAFWASLVAEEGRYHSFRVSLGPPSEYSPGYVFSQPKRYSADEISDLAAVLSNNYKSIGVWYSSNKELEIWGLIGSANWVEIKSSIPGQLLLSMLGGFDIVISGSWWGFVDKAKTQLTDAYFAGIRPEYIIVEYGLEKVSQGVQRSLAYSSIVKSMLEHRHGGTLAIVPEDRDRWRNSVASIRYEVRDIFEEVRQDVDEWNEAIRKQVKSGKWLSFDSPTHRIQEKALQALKFVAQLTAVDGATLIGRDLAVYGFGAKLKPRDSNDKPQTVHLSRPFEGEPFQEIQTSDLGGTRHQSAAQFVYDQRDCVAIVCSQDGRVSMMSWDFENEIVQVVTNLEYAL
jgi:sensor domain DACNV-containing protein